MDERVMQHAFLRCKPPEHGTGRSDHGAERVRVRSGSALGMDCRDGPVSSSKDGAHAVRSVPPHVGMLTQLTAVPPGAFPAGKLSVAPRLRDGVFTLCTQRFCCERTFKGVIK